MIIKKLKYFRASGVPSLQGLASLALNRGNQITVNSSIAVIGPIAAEWPVNDNIQTQLASYANAASGGQNCLLQMFFQGGQESMTLTYKATWS